MVGGGAQNRWLVFGLVQIGTFLGNAFPFRPSHVSDTGLQQHHPMFVAVVVDGLFMLAGPGMVCTCGAEMASYLPTSLSSTPGVGWFPALIFDPSPIRTERLNRVSAGQVLVLDSEGSSYASDVYSFGIVVWEVISRNLPWSNKTRPSEIVFAILKGVRPPFHVDDPVDMVDIAKACWCGEPKERTTFQAILEGMKAEGWVVDDE